jgi:hypothetical protein
MQWRNCYMSVRRLKFKEVLQNTDLRKHWDVTATLDAMSAYYCDLNMASAFKFVTVEREWILCNNFLLRCLVW